MKEKKGGFLRWPWNAAVYIALLAVFRLFAAVLRCILSLVGSPLDPVSGKLRCQSEHSPGDLQATTLCTSGEEAKS